MFGFHRQEFPMLGDWTEKMCILDPSRKENAKLDIQFSHRRLIYYLAATLFHSLHSPTGDPDII
jgi:hypothetical protein